MKVVLGKVRYYGDKFDIYRGVGIGGGRIIGGGDGGVWNRLDIMMINLILVKKLAGIVGEELVKVVVAAAMEKEAIFLEINFLQTIRKV